MEKKSKPKFSAPAVSRRAATFDFETKETEKGARIIRGHGSVFEVESEDLGGFKEIIHRGAFDDALEKSDIRCLFNHDPNIVLGRNTSGTLKLGINERGLYYECELPDNTWGRDVSVSMDRGDITQSSFAFTMDWDNEAPKEDGGAYEYEQREDGSWLLHIHRVEELFDVSPVTYPAYKAADVRSAQRGLEAAIERKEKEEQAAFEAAQKDIEAEGEKFAVEAAERKRRIKILQLKSAV